ncbi:MAG: LysR family transcriptional regulator, partial [Burkholderiales bacterium]
APHTRLTNAAVPAERVADALGRREIDLAIGIIDPKQRGIRSTLLFRERYMALSRRDCPAAWRSRSGFTDAALVVAAPTATYHQGIAESLERHRLGHRIVVRARHFAAIPDLVAGGELVAIVPEMFAQMACARLRLAMWPVPLAMPPYEVGMVWHAATDRDAAQIWLRERVLRLFRRGSTDRGKAKAAKQRG